MNRLSGYSLFILVFAVSGHLFAQNPSTPLGQWRIHLPFKDIQIIQETPSKIYCAGLYGFFTYDKGDGSTVRCSPINGFGGYRVQAMDYDANLDILIIAYADSRIELVKGNTITRNDDIYNKTIVGEKTIHHINIVNGIAYISTSFGLLEFNLSKNEIRNSYLNIGPGGSVLNIFSSCIQNDSLYIASNLGIYRGSTNPNVNLGISENWTLCKAANIQATQIGSHLNTIYAELDSFLYQYKNGKWQLMDTSKRIITNIDNDHNKLIIGVYGKHILTVDESGTISTKIVNVLNDCLLDGNGFYWYASPINGLSFMDPYGPEKYFYPNGPRSYTTFNMCNAFNQMYVTAGGMRATTYAPTFNGFKFYTFDNFEWNYLQDNALTFPLYDYTHMAFNKVNNRLYVGTHGTGLLMLENGQPKQVWNQNNSPLRPRSGLYTIVNGVAIDSRNNVWVSNFDVDTSLHMVTAAGVWRSYKMPVARTGKIVIDNKGNKWILTPQESIGMIAFKDNNTPDNLLDDIIIQFSSNKGTGNLPSNNVNDIAFTKSGELLIGTDQGFAKIRVPSNAFNPNAKPGDYDAQRVIISVEANSNLGGYLLGSEVINCIVVDGGDRRWFGTNNGAWLIDKDGETILLHFTTDNSPLMSNNVTSISIMDETGEVFFGTDLGIASYRADAMLAPKGFETLKIFPNPVKPEYTGDIGISGMPDNTLVKITDINGNLVYQTYSNGGLAVWNGNNFDGIRVSTGVYLVFCINTEGTDTQVGKILFIH